MATSILTGGGIVEFAAALFGTDDDPMDPVIKRDGLVHGLLHAADSMAQVRVNYNPILAGASEGQDSFETIETPASTSDFLLVGGTPFGPWPLTIRANGAPYKLRVRFAGAVASTVATATFRVVIFPLIRISTSDITLAVDSTFEATTSSATVDWISGTSQGTVGSSTLITVTARQAQSWTREVEVFNAVSSPAAGVSIEQVRVMAYVFAKTTDVTKLPRMHALHIEEYIGT